MAFVSHLEGENGTALGFLREAEEILKERKDDTELLVTYGNYAWVHYHSENLEEVSVYLEKVEEITKPLPQGDTLSIIHGERGWTFLRLGSSLYERSRESFEKALEGEPENVSHNVGYAVVLYRLEGVDREQRGTNHGSRAVARQLEKALELEPENTEVMMFLALKLQSEDRDKERAKKLMAQAKRMAPNTPQVNLHGNTSIRALSKEKELKLKALQCPFTWNIDPTDISGFVSETLLFRIRFCPASYHAIYYNILAFVSHLEGENGTALSYLSKAEEILKERKDDTELLVTYGNYAWVHYHSENWVKVGVYLEKVEEITKPLPQGGTLSIIHGEKGWTFLRLDASLYQRSRESFEKALEGKPENVSHNVGYAVVLYRLEGLNRNQIFSNQGSDQTTIQLEKALGLDPDNAEVMVLLALKLQSERRDRQRALQLITKAVEIAHDAPQILRYVGKYYRVEGRVQDSLEVFHRALNLAPDVGILHHQMGICQRSLLRTLHKRKASPGEIHTQVNECIRFFSKAVELQPSNAPAKMDLAEVLGHAHREDEAERIYRELRTDRRMTGPDLQRYRVCYGVFLMDTRGNDFGAVEQFRLAYQIPDMTSDRKTAGTKLRHLAQRMGVRGRKMDEWEILDFLRRENNKQRKIADRSKMAATAGWEMADGARSKMAATAGSKGADGARSKMAATAGSKGADGARSKMAATAGSEMADGARSKMAATAGSKMDGGDAENLLNNFKGMKL